MKQVKIMLDAGHYGKYNWSAAVKAYYESDFTFKFCNMLKEHLEDYGILADITRNQQVNDDKLTIDEESMVIGEKLVQAVEETM